MNLEIKTYARTYLACMRNLLIYMTKNKGIALGEDLEKVISELFNYDPNIFEVDLRILSEKYLQSVIEQKKKTKFLFGSDFKKPEVALNVILTSKGNLAVWWGPRYYKEVDSIPYSASNYQEAYYSGSDFDSFGTEGQKDFFARPENEIAFIRAMGCIVLDNFNTGEDYPSIESSESWDNSVNEVGQSEKYLIYLVLKAAKALILEIENTLSIFFDVSYSSNLEIIEVNEGYYGRIYNVPDRLKKQAAQREIARIEREKERQEILKTSLSPLNVYAVREFIAKAEKEQLETWLKNETRKGAITILKTKLNQR